MTVEEIIFTRWVRRQASGSMMEMMMTMKEVCLTALEGWMAAAVSREWEEVYGRKRMSGETLATLFSWHVWLTRGDNERVIHSCVLEAAAAGVVLKAFRDDIDWGEGNWRGDYCKLSTAGVNGAIIGSNREKNPIKWNDEMSDSVSRAENFSLFFKWHHHLHIKDRIGTKSKQ